MRGWGGRGRAACEGPASAQPPPSHVGTGSGASALPASTRQRVRSAALCPHLPSPALDRAGQRHRAAQCHGNRYRIWPLRHLQRPQRSLCARRGRPGARPGGSTRTGAWARLQAGRRCPGARTRLFRSPPHPHTLSPPLCPPLPHAAPPTLADRARQRRAGRQRAGRRLHAGGRRRPRPGRGAAGGLGWRAGPLACRGASSRGAACPACPHGSWRAGPDPPRSRVFCRPSSAARSCQTSSRAWAAPAPWRVGGHAGLRGRPGRELCRRRQPSPRPHTLHRLDPDAPATPAHPRRHPPPQTPCAAPPSW